MADDSAISTLIEQYGNQVKELTGKKGPLSPDEVFFCLVTRDRIAYLWKTHGPPEPAVAQQIEHTDQQLRKLEERITQLEQLDDWRKNLQPAEDAWWWRFRSEEGWIQRFDWLATALALVFLTISAALVTDIVPRFFSGGPDAKGAIIVMVQSVLVLLTTSSVLTKSGQEAGKRILGSFKISRQWWQEIAAGAALLLLIALIFFRQYIPTIAVSYNDEGLVNYCAGRLSSAQSNYNRALKLNQDYLEAHYNLAQLYEDLGDFKQANTEYQIALQGGLTVAYNSLARLNILAEDYTAAIPLLRFALLAVDKGDLRGQLVRCDPDSRQAGQIEIVAVPVADLRYELLKNLGWARLGQERYDEARTYLDEAAGLIQDKAPAYCLRAQVLEGLDDPERALGDWESCLQYASGDNRDEDKWIGLARQRFQTESTAKENN